MVVFLDFEIGRGSYSQLIRSTWLATRHVMNQQMIGKSWLEWENDLPDDSDSAEEEFLEYRQTVKKETPQLTIDHDIKSEVRYDHIHFFTNMSAQDVRGGQSAIKAIRKLPQDVE